MMGIASFRLFSGTKTKQQPGLWENAMASKARRSGFWRAVGCFLGEDVRTWGGLMTCSALRFSCLERKRRKWAVGKWRGTRDLRRPAVVGCLWWPVVDGGCPVGDSVAPCPAAAAHLFTIPCACPPCAALATRDGTRGDSTGGSSLQ